jgi:hypothetical protein
MLDIAYQDKSKGEHCDEDALDVLVKEFLHFGNLIRAPLLVGLNHFLHKVALVYV